MRNVSKQELDKILDNHKLWLSSNGEKGERANLRSADLSFANFEFCEFEFCGFEFCGFGLFSIPTMVWWFGCSH